MIFNWSTVVMVIWGCFVFTQSKCQDVQKMIPASPNAASLGKYGDIPVSLYNGTADITVSLYEIKTGDIIVPITLSYHTGGIRLNELAGWTGLGFAFNAGGVITREVLGFDDLLNLGGTIRPELASKGSVASTHLFFGDTDNSKVINSSKGEIFSFKNIFGIMESYDMEYDIFNYNFLGKTGRFIINHAGQAVLEQEDDIKIELTAPEDYFHKFKITDERGFVYYFKATETAPVEQQSSRSTISWYMTRIESPKGYSVDFAYNGGSSPRIGQTQQSSTIACYTGPSATIETTVSSVSYTNALILDSITFDNGSVDILWDNLRQDYSGQKITGLKIRSKTSKKVIKEVSFEYDYFLKNTVGSGVMYKRLKLLSVTEKANGGSIPPHTFSYYEPEYVGNAQFMYVGSYSVDHWGYYNKISNNALLPAYSGNIDVGSGNSFQTLSGANRRADAGSVGRAFSLNQIVYPTGGSTVLDLETNTYDISYNDVIEAPEPEYVEVDTILRWDKPGTISGKVDLTRAEGVIKVYIGFVPTTAARWDSVKMLYPEGSAWVDIGPIHRDVKGDFVNNACPGPTDVCTLTEQLDRPAIFNYSGHIASGMQKHLSLISVRLVWTQKKFQQGSNEDKVGYGGGLRVRMVTNYDEKGNKVAQKIYDYHYRADVNGDGIDELHSYGRQLSRPSYTRYDLVAQVDQTGTSGNFCAAFSRYSNSVMPLTTSIGYDQVVETIVDYTARNTNTRTLRVFENKADSIYDYSAPGNRLNGLSGGVTGMHPFGVQNVSYRTNGLLKSQIDYQYVNGNYVPLRETYNTWLNKILANYYSIKHEYFMVASGIRLVMTYPALRSERIFLDRSQTVLHDLASQTSLTTEDVFEYGVTHTQQTKRIHRESSGRTVTECKIYPPDYGNLTSTAGGIKLLQEKHVIGGPVEEYVTIQETPSSPKKILKASLTTFKTNVPLPDMVYRMETKSPPWLSNFVLSNSVSGTFSRDTLYKPILAFTTYSNRGNATQMAKDKNINFAYKWQYNETYPTVECKNCVADKFLYEGFEETNNNTTSDGRTGEKSYPAAYTVVVPPGAGPYTLTYWQKSGSNKWQPIRINNVTSNQTIGGNGMSIDDVRLIPAGAMMTTYTYTPLIGMTSMTDANNVTLYYEYDTLQRLTIIKDQDGNIVKRYTYNYFLK